MLLVLLWAAPALADPVAVHPSLWHVTGPVGDAWLFGAVHILPPGLDWRTPDVRAAIASADVFVFEVSNDSESMADVRGIIASRGMLPPHQHLRRMLAPAARADFDKALAASGLPLAAVDHERPWLVSLQMMFAQMAREKYSGQNGVDVTLMNEARAAHKDMRYFETVAQQFALLAPADPRLEMEEFQADLKDLGKPDDFAPLVAAWSQGDQVQLDKLMNDDLSSLPGARKALLDDRNRNWLVQMKAMLGEKHTYFVTVGAGHLTGTVGLPALLRAAGYKVDGT